MIRRFGYSAAVIAIMAAAITGSNTWSGLPVGVGSLGTALASWPLSRLMARFGRRPGLTVGYSLAVVGAALGMLGVVQQSFALFLAGCAGHPDQYSKTSLPLRFDPPELPAPNPAGPTLRFDYSGGPVLTWMSSMPASFWSFGS